MIHAAPARGESSRRCLWVIPVADLGGVARHALDTTTAGIPGWLVSVLCPEGPLAAALRDRGVPVVTGSVAPGDGVVTAVREVRRVAGRLRPDVLHSHLAFADVTAALAVSGLRSGAGRRIRVVSTEHGISGVRGLYHSTALRSRVTAGIHRARLRRTDRIIAVSESTKQQVVAQWGSGEKVSVIRNGVDPPRSSTRAVPGLRVLSLARLSHEKRIDDLLRAFAVVADAHPEARLTVAGTGPEEPKLRALAFELGVGATVSFPGHVDPEAALRTHDVVAQLSRWENLSYTLLDAVAHGVGVVATDVGGNGEIVPSTCLVPADEPDVVARAIVMQGMDLARRPARYGAGQSVAASCDLVAENYHEVMS